MIVFDKTSMLTMGEPRVMDVVAAEGWAAEKILWAAAVERGSDHPLALAIVERAEGLDIPPARAFLNFEGKGARAEVEPASSVRTAPNQDATRTFVDIWKPIHRHQYIAQSPDQARRQ